MPNCPRRGRCGPRTRTALASGSRTTPRSNGPAGPWSCWPTAWEARAKATWPVAWPWKPPCERSGKPSREPRPARPSGRCSPPPTWRSTTRAWSTRDAGTHGHHAHHRRCCATTNSPSDTWATAAPTSSKTDASARLTADHSYAAMQVKLGLISEHDAANSQMRCMLTRSVGREPAVQVDYYTVQVNRGDRLVQCSDGLHQCVTRRGNLRDRHARPARRGLPPPGRAGREARHRRQSLRAGRRDPAASSSSTTIADCPCTTSRTCPRSHELEVGQVLDERFQITELISRSGMASIFKAKDLKTGQRRRQGAVPAIRERSRLLLAFPAGGGDRQAAQPSLHSPRGDGRGGEEPALHRHGVSQGPDAAAGVAERGAACRWPTPPSIAARICEGLEYLHRQEHHPPRPEAGKHHALRRRQHPHHGFRHRQGRRAAAADVRRLFRRAWARPTTWPRNRSKANAATPAPISTAWARCSTKCSPAQCPSRAPTPTPS